MKNKSIITILSLCLGLSMATTSCDDMLSSESERHSYEVAGDTLYSYWGILQSLQNIGERYVILGECRGDLVDGGEFTTDSVKAILSFGLNGDVENIRDGANRYLKVSDYYHIINSCNAYLAQVDTVLEKANGERYMLREYAQVEAIRAWTYMQLVNNYGDVPYYETPMLSTEDINNFNSKEAQNRVNPLNLWEKLETKLVRAFEIERQWGYPQYDIYGFKNAVCHSSKAMFPVSLVLADLYLMGNQFEKAAEYYYEFLDGKHGGVLPRDYYSTAFTSFGEDHPKPTNNGYPWNETGATNTSQESITAIPSSINSLWGIVQRGVNDLFGFEATIRQSTSSSDSTTTASIYLTRNWERQLGPSAGYDNLRLSQKYEIYQADNISSIENAPLYVLEGVGDARGVAGSNGSGYISSFGSGDYYTDEIEKTQRYIMKQNPYGGYSTVYPMVYRKSLVWLRYAEALNRAGYPGHAFAILKNGLVRNDKWRPSTSESDFAVKQYRVCYEHRGTQEVLNDETGEIEVVPTHVLLPEDWETNEKCLITGPDYNLEQFKADSAKFVEYIWTGFPDYQAHFDSIKVDTIGQCCTRVAEEYADFMTQSNYLTNENNEIVCDYISLSEMKKSSKEWLDFNKNQFNGTNNLPVKFLKIWPIESGTQPQEGSYPTDSRGYVTRGIHQKGCGLLKYNEKNSSYNFFDQVNLKLKAAGKTPYNELRDMYEGDITTKTDIIQAVEDLIIDEAALELAFEGHRFPDLMRVALRREAIDGNSAGEYMVNKISARGSDTGWASSLVDKKNWYLPLPDYSNRPQ